MLLSANYSTGAVFHATPDTVDRSPASPALRPFSFNRHLSDGRPSRKSMYVFRVYKKYLAELRRELVTGYTVRRYEQLETLPEMIEQELRPAVYER